MGVTLSRGIIGGLGVVLMVVGIALIAVPGLLFTGALFCFLPGAILLGGVLLERTRYRSLHAEQTGEAHGPGGGETKPPAGRFQPTPEQFVDPTTGTRMRVWLDPATGERRYVAEG